MKTKMLYTTSLGQKILSAKRNISMLIHGKKKSVDMTLYIGDLLWPYNGQPTISQYYLAARYLDAKLVKGGVYDYSYCEELSKAYRGTANPKEKTIEYMKKFREFLDELDTNGFNPTLGKFSIANDPRGIFFDDGTHRLAGLLLNKVKYIPVRIEDRNTKYDLNGREILENSSIDRVILKEIERNIAEICSLFSSDLFVLVRKDVCEDVCEIFKSYGQLTPIQLRNNSVNEKVRESDFSPEVWGIYYKYKDTPCNLYHFSIPDNLIHLNKNCLKSNILDQIEKKIPYKNWGFISHSLTWSIEAEMSFSRLITSNFL